MTLSIKRDWGPGNETNTRKLQSSAMNCVLTLLVLRPAALHVVLLVQSQWLASRQLLQPRSAVHQPCLERAAPESMGDKRGTPNCFAPPSLASPNCTPPMPHLQHRVLHPAVVQLHVLSPVGHQHHSLPADHKVGVGPHGCRAAARRRPAPLLPVAGCGSAAISSLSVRG